MAEDNTPGPRDGPPPREAVERLLDLLPGLVADRLAGGPSGPPAAPTQEAGRAKPR